jgi:hypothetical protein
MFNHLEIQGLPPFLIKSRILVNAVVAAAMHIRCSILPFCGPADFLFNRSVWLGTKRASNSKNGVMAAEVGGPSANVDPVTRRLREPGLSLSQGFQVRMVREPLGIGKGDVQIRPSIDNS